MPRHRAIEHYELYDVDKRDLFQASPDDAFPI